MKFEYYSILEIKKTATIDEIKKAYRKKALKYHPDRAPEDKKKDYEEKFKKINEAYSVLSDKEKRSHYDRFGTSGFAGTGGFSGVDLSDIFEQFFGGHHNGTKAKRRTTTQVGEDLEQIINIDLKVSVYGEKRKIKVKKRVSCVKCEGQGGHGKKTCTKCEGSGYITYTTQSLFGVVQQTGTCDECNGTGEKFDKICEFCSGTKRVLETKEIDLDIPAGIDNGMVIKLEGEGNDGIGIDAPGSLYLKFNVNLEEKGLKRKGYDLYYHIEIDVVESILGTIKELNIPVIGKRKIEIKAGTQPGEVLEIVGDGVKHIDSDKKGNLYITIQVKIPKKLLKKERDLYLEIARHKKINVLNKKGIFEKIFG